MDIRALAFDAGGTVLDWHGGDRRRRRGARAAPDAGGLSGTPGAGTSLHRHRVRELPSAHLQRFEAADVAAELETRDQRIAALEAEVQRLRRDSKP